MAARRIDLTASFYSIDLWTVFFSLLFVLKLNLALVSLDDKASWFKIWNPSYE